MRCHKYLYFLRPKASKKKIIFFDKSIVSYIKYIKKKTKHNTSNVQEDN